MDLSQTFKANGRIPKHVEIMIGKAMIERIKKVATRKKRMPSVRGGCSGWEAKWGQREKRMMGVLSYIEAHPGTSIGDVVDGFLLNPSTVGDYIKSLRDAGLLTTVRGSGGRSLNTITDKGRERLRKLDLSP